MRIKMLAAFTLTLAGAFAGAEEHHPHWTYAGEHGVDHWAEMEPGFATCKSGQEQSPIDIRPAKARKAKLDPIAFNYAAGAAEVVNNGHTIQVNVPAGSTIRLAGVDYKLVQFHFHSPSEEEINGKTYPLVGHFVHKNDDGQLAVVAVLFKEGKENRAIKQIFDRLPGKEGDSAQLEGLDPAAILPAERSYYAFAGSLTTPPCSEGVRWQVLRTSVEMSRSQIAAFRKLYRVNARPVQPLNGREVLISS